MGRFDRKYSDAQREAMTSAMLDKGTPAKRVQQLARAGELDGLEPFDPPLSTINTYAQHERKRRRGKLVEGLAAGPIPEANEAITRRLLQIAERESQWLANQKEGQVDMARYDRLTAAMLRLQQLAAKVLPQLPPDERAARGKHTRDNQPTGLLADLSRAQRKDRTGQPEPTFPSANEEGNAELVANYGSLQHRTAQPTNDATSDFLADAGSEEASSRTQSRAELAAELAQHPAIQRGSDA